MAEASGNDANGLLAGISDKLIRALPPAMTLLILMNICFLGVTAYIFSHNTDVRNQMLTRIIDTCLKDHSP